MMKLEGWNDAPDGFYSIVNFDQAPSWLKIISRTPLLERFAYPLGVKRGLGLLLVFPNSESLQPSFSEIGLAESRGWRILSGEPTLLELADMGIYPYAKMISKSKDLEHFKNPIRRILNHFFGAHPAFSKGYVTREGRRKARFKYNREVLVYLKDMKYGDLV